MAGPPRPATIKSAWRCRYFPGMSARVIPIPPKPSAVETLKRRGGELIPSTPKERAELLDGTTWCHKLSWGEEEGIAQFLRLFRLRPGSMLFREGDHDEFAAIVVEGQLEIHKGDSEAHDHLVARLSRGKMVGEMSLIDGAARSASAIAVGTTDILVLTADDFERMSVDKPEFALKFAMMIAESIAQLLRQTTGSLVDHLDQGGVIDRTEL